MKDKKYVKSKKFLENLKSLRDNLVVLNVEPLDKLMDTMSFEEFEGILYDLAYDRENGDSNIFVYTYMLSMLGKGRDDWRIHLSVSRLMGMILNHIDGAESIGLFHALEAHNLKPLDADTLEIILYYNHIPEKILTDEKAIYYSKKLLRVKPESNVARS